MRDHFLTTLLLAHLSGVRIGTTVRSRDERGDGAREVVRIARRRAREATRVPARARQQEQHVIEEVPTQVLTSRLLRA